MTLYAILVALVTHVFGVQAEPAASVFPPEGHLGTPITIDGIEIGIGKPVVEFRGTAFGLPVAKKLNVTSFSTTSVSTVVSVTVPGVYDVVIRPKSKSLPLVLVPAAFLLRSPEITGVAPSEIAPGSNFTIFGSGFATKSSKVVLRSSTTGAVFSTSIVSISSSEIRCKSGNIGLGMYDVLVLHKKAQFYQASSAGALRVDGPFIASVLPSNFIPGAKLEIYGLRFGEKMGSVKLGNLSLGIIHWSDERVDCQAPSSMPTASPSVLRVTNTVGSAVWNLPLEDQTPVCKFIDNVNGGTLAATNPQSALFGLSIELPPGATESGVFLCASPVSGSSGLFGGAFAFQLTPITNLMQSAQIRITYSDSDLASWGVPSASEHTLMVFQRKAPDNKWVPVLNTSLQTEANIISATVSELGQFAVLSYSEHSNFIDTNVIRDSAALFLGSLAHELDFGALVKELAINPWQEPRLIRKKGSGFHPAQTNVLIIHGMLSSDKYMSSLVHYASNRYDNVYVYEYPSAMRIDENAMTLKNLMMEDLGQFPWLTSFDIIAHSMGGLVARCLLEYPGIPEYQFGTVANVVLLGVPNLGTNQVGLATIGSVFYESSPQLLPGSAFLSTLNQAGPPSQDWARYLLIGSDTGGDSDGLVAPASALGDGLFNTNHTTRKLLTGSKEILEHSNLKDKIYENGVAQTLDGWIEPHSMIPQIKSISKSVSVGSYELEFGKWVHHGAVFEATLVLDDFAMIPAPFQEFRVVFETSCGDTFVSEKHFGSYDQCELSLLGCYVIGWQPGPPSNVVQFRIEMDEWKTCMPMPPVSARLEIFSGPFVVVGENALFTWGPF